MGVGGQRHVSDALPLGKKRYPLYRRLSRLQDRSGWERFRSPDHPARNESLYRPHYPGPRNLFVRMLNNKHHTSECNSKISYEYNR